MAKSFREKALDLVLPCLLCGEGVRFTGRAGGRRYAKLIERNEMPICRHNGCAAMARYSVERQRGAEKPGVARGAQGVIATHVASMVFVPAGGESGDECAPLAKGRVKRVGARGCVGKGAVDG